MEDKTPLYMVLIVAIVAIVGIIIMVSSGPKAVQTSNTMPTGNVVSNAMPTGNVVYESTSVNLNDFGKVFFAAFLVGIAAYMYFRNE